jgi:phosphoadenosine phosphosulfate reductase
MEKLELIPYTPTTLSDKVASAVRILKLAEKEASAHEQPVEIAYSGGKDSDVLLQLAKESGIQYRAIYKNTTIDPPGTMRHVREMGVEVMQPKMSFFDVIKKKGMPTHARRHCCRVLKEYKVLDVCCQGIRTEESEARKVRYTSFEQCRVYGKDKRVRQYFPIWDWTLADVKEFVASRGLKLAPAYYREDGSIDFDRRLGCMGCPLAGDRSVDDFKKNPALLRAWLKAGAEWLAGHKFRKGELFGDVYEQFACNTFFKSYKMFDEARCAKLFGENPSFKEMLEKYFEHELDCIPTT